MHQQVKGCRGKSPATDTEHHVADLAHGRVGQNSLQVPLDQGAGSGIKGGDSSGHGDSRTSLCRQADQRKETNQQVDTGRNHGGGMNQGGNRSRAGHGIRQPDHEGHLGRLPHRPSQEEKTYRRDNTRRQQRCHPVDFIDGKGSAQGKQPENCHAEGHVPDAGHEKGLASGIGILFLPVPETDQAIGAEADSFPAEEQEGKISGQHQQQHGADKQAHQRKEPGIVALSSHISMRIDQDNAGDKGDHQTHHRGKGVKIEGKGCLQVEGRQPAEQIEGSRGTVREKGAEGGDKRTGNRAAGYQTADATGKSHARQGDESARQNRQNRYQGQKQVHAIPPVRGTHRNQPSSSDDGGRPQGPGPVKPRPKSWR